MAEFLNSESLSFACLNDDVDGFVRVEKKQQCCQTLLNGSLTDTEQILRELGLMITNGKSDSPIVCNVLWQCLLRWCNQGSFMEFMGGWNKPQCFSLVTGPTDLVIKWINSLIFIISNMDNKVNNNNQNEYGVTYQEWMQKRQQLNNNGLQTTLPKSSLYFYVGYPLCLRSISFLRILTEVQNVLQQQKIQQHVSIFLTNSLEPAAQSNSKDNDILFVGFSSDDKTVLDKNSLQQAINTLESRALQRFLKLVKGATVDDPGASF